MLGMVVCNDSTRRQELLDLVAFYSRHMPVPMLSFATPLDAINGLGATPPTVDFVAFSLVGGGDALQGLSHLKGACGKARVIIEFDLNQDKPKDAIELLRQGAFVVVSKYLQRRSELWGIITDAMEDETPFATIMSVARPPKKPMRNWGFMSMTFNPGDQNHNDHKFAIKRVMELLRLELHRVDRMSFSSTVLLDRVKQAIADHDVIVAQISATTENTMYEVGYADSLEKELIVLWRRGSQPVPTLIENFVRVEYATMTELAMKLFFGLGGTKDDL